MKDNDAIAKMKSEWIFDLFLCKSKADERQAPEFTPVNEDARM